MNEILRTLVLRYLSNGTYIITIIILIITTTAHADLLKIQIKTRQPTYAEIPGWHSQEVRMTHSHLHPACQIRCRGLSPN